MHHAVRSSPSDAYGLLDRPIAVSLDLDSHVFVDGVPKPAPSVSFRYPAYRNVRRSIARMPSLQANSGNIASARQLLQKRIPAMSERDTFGPRLRSERERRGISLETISTLTNVGVELWEGLERNDFSRWPRGIFARAFVRDYARAVGIDADEVVEEFCRLYPVGDRRASRVLRAQAELIGHESELHEDPLLIPGGVERRGTGRQGSPQAASARLRLAPRVVAAAFDTLAICASAALLAVVTPLGVWPSVALIALVYYGTGTIATGASPGTRVTDLLQHRVPTLFTPTADHRAHA